MTIEISIVDIICRYIAFACFIGFVILEIWDIHRFKKLERNSV